MSHPLFDTRSISYYQDIHGSSVYTRVHQRGNTLLYTSTIARLEQPVAYATTYCFVRDGKIRLRSTFTSAGRSGGFDNILPLPTSCPPSAPSTNPNHTHSTPTRVANQQPG